MLRFRTCLLNGGEGIAVGMATRVPTHNLRGIAEAIPLRPRKQSGRSDPNCSVPDWPTGCDIVKDEGLTRIPEHWSMVRVSGCVPKCRRGDELNMANVPSVTQLVFTALPIHVNTEQVGDQIKNALEKGQITTVADVRDETDMNGTRFAVVLRANASVQLAKDEIFKYTSLDTKFGANNLAIDGTTPVQYGPYKILETLVGVA